MYEGNEERENILASIPRMAFEVCNKAVLIHTFSFTKRCGGVEMH